MLQKITFVCFLFALLSCNTFKNGLHKSSQSEPPITQVIKMDTVRISAAKQMEYHASAPRIVDLVDTKLAVNFDWVKKRMPGKATLTLTPHFAAVDSVVIDAKGFNINSVAFLDCGTDTVPLHFSYDSLLLTIQLNHSFKRNDTFILFIDYVAKPYERKTGSGVAITSDRGLYFINADGKDKTKPRELWTQGETESASCWFPTLDKPNQKCTQKMYITIPKGMESLSNGTKLYSRVNEDSTETDVWQMDKPHCPYLFMMAVGEFSTYEDEWHGIPVKYYVDLNYQEYVQEIFGKTPAMIDCFSRKLKYDFPWSKYSQVVVHDYVSGAMENTTATLHGEFLQQTSREMLDKNNQDVIAHELFHQWFGDLVTCESWSHLTLNESFATYGEYIWEEDAYGKDIADIGLEQDLQAYLSESKRKMEPIVRFYYNDKDDMFDRHTYQKGGRIIHQLRNLVGDSVFFESLHYYLKQNEFQSAEVTDLRQAFEHVSGLDLSQFFQQWYYTAGHPKLNITYNFSTDLKKATVQIEQTQSEPAPHIYNLPMKVDVYTAAGVKTYQVVMNRRKQTFTFDADEKPYLINVDADKILICEKTDGKTLPDFIYQYEHAPLFKDRLEALEAANRLQNGNNSAKELLLNGMRAGNWYLRKFAVENMNLNDSVAKEKAIPVLQNVAATDKNNNVRAAAIKRLGLISSYASNDLFTKCTQDSSLAVASEALKALVQINPMEALKAAYALENDENAQIRNAVAKVYADKGTPENYLYFQQQLNKKVGFERYPLIGLFGNYLYRQPDFLIEKGTLLLDEIAITDPQWTVRYAAYQSIKHFKTKYNADTEKDRISVLQSMLDEIKTKETNPQLKEIYSGEKQD